MTGFGVHEGHAVCPHHHAGQPNEEPPFRRGEWCSGRWLCATCADKDHLPRGTWFWGPECARPKSAAKESGRRHED